MLDPTLRKQVERAAHNAAQRTGDTNPTDWLERLVIAAQSPNLADRIALARSHRWAGAIPSWEAVDTAKITNATHLPAVGIDGSQVYPDQRSAVKWAYIQSVGYRTGYSPLFACQFVDIGEQISNGDGLWADELVENDELMGLTNAWRTLLEMRQGRDAAIQHPGSLVLFDNGLLPWLSVSGATADRQLKEYLDNLAAIRPGLVAGYISGPQSRLLARLIHLSEAKTVEDGMTECSGVLDQTIMRQALQPGERSALFLHGSPRNQVFQDIGAGVYFFFLKVNKQEVARVEIPAWMAEDPRVVDTVHATALADARSTGYPYVLAQAHNQVVITGEVATQLRNVAETVYMQETGRQPKMSAKAEFKRS